VLLSLLQWQMHPTYGNTSRRGRGIGGQAITQQCSAIDPEEDWEFALLDEIEQALRSRYQDDEEFAAKIGAKMAELKQAKGWWNDKGK
jgi:hypothetical protein